MDKRGEIGEFGTASPQGYGRSVGFEQMGRFSRVLRAASRLQMQPGELMAASHGLSKTATLTVLRCGIASEQTSSRSGR